MRAFLQAPSAPSDPTPIPTPEPNLSVTNVTLARDTDTFILKNISFEVPAGAAIGVIGKSGSGKTSLARVLTGLATPNRGKVRLGGATLDQFAVAQRSALIGYLPQNVLFFNGSVAENIAQMALMPDSERVVEAAKRARIHDIILGLSSGYDTQLSSDALILSGGQKQRLALARALYGRPALLVLDEPNSALDAEGSDALNRLVTQMKEAGKTVVIMTHRPTAISACDTLLMLEAGAIAAFGPRDEVVKSMMRNARAVGKALINKSGAVA